MIKQPPEIARGA